VTSETKEEETGYRRGCQQAISLAIYVLTENKIPLYEWRWYLEGLESTLGKMRYAKSSYPVYMRTAMEKAWGKHLVM
jgi:hypothetical protein